MILTGSQGNQEPVESVRGLQYITIALDFDLISTSRVKQFSDG